MKIGFRFFFLILLLAQLSVLSDAYANGDPLLCPTFPFAVRGPEQLLHAQIAHIRAYRFIEGQFLEAKIQIDEVNSLGDYVLENGLPFTAHTGDGIFNGRDEIVFDSAEFGDDFDVKKIPQKLQKSSSWLKKIAFKIANLHCRHHLLLVEHTQDQTPKAFKSLFDPANQTVESDEFLYRFNRQSPMLLGEVYLKASDHQLSQVFAKSNFVMPLVSSHWYFPDMSFEAADFKSSIESWRNGPIRSIIAVGSKYKNFFSLINLHLFSELVFYRNRFQIPTKVEFIFDTDDFLKRGSGLGYAIDFPKDKIWELKTNLTPLPQNSLDGQAVSDRLIPRRFFAHGSRPEGQFWLTVDVDERAQQMVPPPFIIYREMFRDPLYQKTLPWLAKNNGDLGFYLDIAGIKKGMYDFRLDLTLSRSNQEFKTSPFEVSPSVGPQQTQESFNTQIIVWETLLKEVMSKSNEKNKEL